MFRAIVPALPWTLRRLHILSRSNGVVGEGPFTHCVPDTSRTWLDPYGMELAHTGA